MADAPYKLILLRHGESEWNAKNLFTGWVDVNLTEKGEKEAVRGGELLKDAGLLPDVLHTSLQKRAIRTAQLALESADRHWIPVHRSWRLNERHYGALQGKDKAQTLAEFGEEQFMLWRRSYDTPPPPLDGRRRVLPVRRPALRDHPAGAAPAHGVPEGRRRPHAPVLVRRHRPGPPRRPHGPGRRPRQQPPRAWSSTSTASRTPTSRASTSRRASRSSYELDADFKPLNPGGTYLDPDAAAAAIEAVKNQGKKK